MLSGIAEKGLCVKRKVKMRHSPGITNDKTIKKLDDLIKDKPDDLITLLAPMFFRITLSCCIMQNKF